MFSSGTDGTGTDRIGATIYPADMGRRGVKLHVFQAQGFSTYAHAGAVLVED